MRESFEEDEVGVIGETFKRITSENVQLNERLIHSQLKEREAELRTLQAQIKPHFLYNTLDSIYWMAVIQNNEDIAKMAVSLSESFKLSLNKGKETIPVFKELQHIEHYMTIQNLRYNERFQYIRRGRVLAHGFGNIKAYAAAACRERDLSRAGAEGREGTISPDREAGGWNGCFHW